MTCTGDRKTRAIQILDSHIACRQIAVEKSTLSKEEVDKLFVVEIRMSGQKVVLPLTPEAIVILKRLFMEV
jgi:hypothetical protein